MRLRTIATLAALLLGFLSANLNADGPVSQKTDAVVLAGGK